MFVSLDIDLARYAVRVAGELGSDYAEGRLHSSKELVCILKNGEAEPAMIMDSAGLGVRVLVNGALAFAATNNLDRASVKQMVAGAVTAARVASEALAGNVEFAESKSSSASWSAEEKEKFEDITLRKLMALLQDVDSMVKGGVKGIPFASRLLVSGASLDEKVFVNSEGSEVKGRIPRVSFRSYVTAKVDGEVRAVTIPPGYAHVGGSGGWEVFEKLKLHGQIKGALESLAETLKADEKPPKSDVDVVLGPGVAGLVAHESCGHPAEADRILGREAAQAGESYLKEDDIGLKVGSVEASVSDDPSIPLSTGFYVFDDEGVRARKRRLIDSGVITEFLHNRATARHFRLESNASARSVEFDKEPIVRMANTYIEPGDYSFQELVEDIKLGVYIKSFMEWNIDDKRLNQRYVGLEAYLIRNGAVKEPVRNPVLEVTTPKLWSSLDARGKDLMFTAATCGKGDPMQGAPVWTGGPHVRLRSLRLGSR